LLLQNGRADTLVPEADAQALQSAAPEPKTVRWYTAGHGRNPQAMFDRLDWLHAELGLDPRQKRGASGEGGPLLPRPR
jgi:fermentation-respiration switch protein FrsA (DUF1100 family)